MSLSRVGTLPLPWTHIHRAPSLQRGVAGNSVEIISLCRETKQCYNSLECGIKPLCHLSIWSVPLLSLRCSLSLSVYNPYVITHKSSLYVTFFPSVSVSRFNPHVIHIYIRSLAGTQVQIIWILSLKSHKCNFLIVVYTHTHTPLLFVVSKLRSLPRRQEVWM